MFGVELKDKEMDVEVSGPRISGKTIGQAEKVFIELRSGKQYILYVKDGELVKVKGEAE